MVKWVKVYKMGRSVKKVLSMKNGSHCKNASQCEKWDHTIMGKMGLSTVKNGSQSEMDSVKNGPQSEKWTTE